MLRYYGMGSVIALGGIIAACSNAASPDPPDSNPSRDCPPGSDCNHGYNGYKNGPSAATPPYPPYDAGPDGARCTVGPAIECLVEGQYDIFATKTGGDETCTLPVGSREWITSGAFPCPYANDPRATAAGESCSTETDIASCTSTTVCMSTENGVTKTTATTFSGRTLHQTRSTKRANDAGASSGPDCNIDILYRRR